MGKGGLKQNGWRWQRPDGCTSALQFAVLDAIAQYCMVGVLLLAMIYLCGAVTSQSMQTLNANIRSR